MRELLRVNKKRCGVIRTVNAKKQQHRRLNWDEVGWRTVDAFPVNFCELKRGKKSGQLLRNISLHPSVIRVLTFPADSAGVAPNEPKQPKRDLGCLHGCRAQRVMTPRPSLSVKSWSTLLARGCFSTGRARDCSSVDRETLSGHLKQRERERERVWRVCHRQ